jgi:hypothetical protein
MKAKQAPAADTAKIEAGARAMERARICAILDHDEAKGREPLAQYIALQTDTLPEGAIDILKVAGRAKVAPVSAFGLRLVDQQIRSRPREGGQIAITSKETTMGMKRVTESPAVARAELQRWQAILSCPESVGRERMAMHLAAMSDMTLVQARTTMGTAGTAEHDTEAALIQGVLAGAKRAGIPLRGATQAPAAA